jgi:hypothetical protein
VYAFEASSPLDRGQADRVCRAVLDVLHPHIELINEPGVIRMTPARAGTTKSAT